MFRCYGRFSKYAKECKICGDSQLCNDVTDDSSISYELKDFILELVKNRQCSLDDIILAVKEKFGQTYSLKMITTALADLKGDGTLTMVRVSRKKMYSVYGDNQCSCESTLQVSTVQ